MTDKHKFIMEQESEEGVDALLDLLRKLNITKDVTRLRVEVESNEQIVLRDLSVNGVGETSDDEPEPEEPDTEEIQTVEQADKEIRRAFRDRQSNSYKVAVAISESDMTMLTHAQIKQEMDEVPPGVSSYLYGMTERGLLDKQPTTGGNGEKPYKYGLTSKGERAIEYVEQATTP